jgi:diguanylate cyclase (GGDEF)-like protein
MLSPTTALARSRRPALTLLLLLAVLAGREARALDPERRVEEYTITGWTMEDGLPHNLVQRVAQSPEGFLWIGTWEGAARFNGRGFTTFDAHTVPGIDLVGVRSIVPDGDAMLFGTAQYGVFRLADGHWERLGGADAQRLQVTVLLRDRDGALWIGTENGLHRLDADGRLASFGPEQGLAGRLVFSLLQLPEGDLAVGTERGLERVHDGAATPWGSALGLPAAPVRSLLAVGDGALLAGGHAGAWRIGRGESTARRLIETRVEAMLEDRDGQIWLSTAGDGLFRYRDGRFDDRPAQLALSGRGSPALFEDREGLIWVGTTNGLYRIADGPVYGIDSARGLSDGYARVVMETEDGTIWIGHAGGLDRLREDRVEAVPLPGLGDRPASVLALAPARDGGLWLGTYDQGVLHLPGPAGGAPLPRLTRADGLPADHVRALLEDPDGTLWIGTTHGLARRRDGELRVFGSADGLPAGFIRVLYRAPDGVLWIGTSAGIAAIGADERIRAWHPDHGFPAMGSFDFLGDPDGTLWIASDRGLLRLRDGRFTVYDRAAGLPKDTVFRVLDDGRGRLWLSSNHGVFRIARDALDAHDQGRRRQLALEVFDRTDGMPSSQSNGGSAPAGWIGRDGRLWFPTAAGVAVVDPAASDRQPRGEIPIAFERVLIDGQARPPAARYTLGPEVRRVAIAFAGLSFRAPRDVRYRYRMSGFDEGWLEAGPDAEAVYTNLPPGRFRFEVQAARVPVDWSEVHAMPATIEVEVEPPFWRRSGFVAAALVAAVILVDLASRLRSMHYRRRERRLAGLIEQHTQDLRAKNAALERADREREDLLRRLEYQALHDPLTGLPNRRAADAYLLETIGRLSAGGGQLCVGLLDVDHFKRINDEHGHDAGDAVLREVAALLTDALGADGFAARHGGEEFLIALTGQPPAAARATFERLRERIATHRLAAGGERPLQCTASIGLAVWRAPFGPRQLLALADRRLYRAKRRGRNRIVGEDEDDTPVP